MSESDSGDRADRRGESPGLSLDALPDAAVLVDLQTQQVIDLNERAEMLFGYPQVELRGRQLLDCHPSDKKEQYRALFEDVLDGKTHVDSLPDGTPVHIQTSSEEQVPVEISTQTITHQGSRCVLGLFREVSKRREAEESLRTLQTQFRTVFEQSNDAIVLFGADMEAIHEVNPKASEMLGYTREELLSLSPADIHPTEIDKLRSFISSVKETQEGWTDELTCRKKNGEHLDVEISASLVELNQEPYVLAIIRDVSDRVQRERKLQRQREKLDVLNQVVRHDIRNHMQIVLARLELLEPHLDESGETHFEDVVRAAEATVALTETARDLTETMLGEGPEGEPVRFDAVVTSEVDTFRKQHESAVVTVDGTLPTTTVKADEMLDSVVHNLLTNAVVHNDSDTPEIEVSMNTHGDSVTLQIADNGPGIPEDKKDSIFAKGEKGLNSSGTGLGLYLIRTLVEQYGGSVDVADNQPQGSVFTVELPLS